MTGQLPFPPGEDPKHRPPAVTEIKGYSAVLTKLCDRMLHPSHDQRITIPDIIDQLSIVVPTWFGSERMTVKYKFEGNSEEFMVRVPPSMTIRDFVQKVDRSGSVGKTVLVEGRSVNLADAISVLPDNATLVIRQSRDSVSGKMIVKYRRDNHSRAFITKMYVGATVGDLLYVASRNGIKGMNVFSGDFCLSHTGLVGDWNSENDGIFVISSNPPT
jgi:hypothetical protein